MTAAHPVQTLSAAVVAIGVAACAPAFDFEDPAVVALPANEPAVAGDARPLPDDDPPAEFNKDDGVYDDDVGVLDYHIWPGPGL